MIHKSYSNTCHSGSQVCIIGASAGLKEGGGGEKREEKREERSERREVKMEFRPLALAHSGRKRVDAVRS